MVYGDKRKFLTCLVTCDEDYTKSWAEREGLGKKEMKELVKDQRLIDAIDAEIKRFNSQLPSYSTIKRFRILPVDFSQDTGELTPSLKVKRKFVTKKYWDLLEEMYADVR
jgi:long-chain acyl-CoA synthetase